MQVSKPPFLATLQEVLHNLKNVLAISEKHRTVYLKSSAVCHTYLYLLSVKRATIALSQDLFFPNVNSGRWARRHSFLQKNAPTEHRNFASHQGNFIY